MKVHAVVLRTGLVLHEVRTVFSCTKGCFQGPTVNIYIIDRLNGPQCILRFVVRHISTCTRALK